jgi:hypothetical protein
MVSLARIVIEDVDRDAARISIWHRITHGADCA